MKAKARKHPALDAAGKARLDGMVRRYAALPRMERLSVVEACMAAFGVSKVTAYVWLRHGGQSGARRYWADKRNGVTTVGAAPKAATEEDAGKTRAPAANGGPREGKPLTDGTIMSAKTKPEGCSDVRWRIELKRRRMVRRMGPLAMDWLPDPAWV